jgi:hypothetical protein
MAGIKASMFIVRIQMCMCVCVCIYCLKYASHSYWIQLKAIREKKSILIQPKIKTFVCSLSCFDELRLCSC